MSSVVRCILTPHSKQRSASARAEPRLLVGKGVAHYRCCSSSRARASAVYTLLKIGCYSNTFWGVG